MLVGENIAFVEFFNPAQGHKPCAVIRMTAEIKLLLTQIDGIGTVLDKHLLFEEA